MYWFSASRNFEIGVVPASLRSLNFSVKRFVMKLKRAIIINSAIKTQPPVYGDGLHSRVSEFASPFLGDHLCILFHRAINFMRLTHIAERCAAFLSFAGWVGEASSANPRILRIYIPLSLMFSAPSKSTYGSFLAQNSSPSYFYNYTGPILHD